MRRFVIGIVLAASAAVAATTAFATDISFTYYGKITEGMDVTGLFGAAGANLTGDRIIATFIFDPTLGIRVTTPGVSDALFGGTDAPGDPASPLVAAYVSINGSKPVEIGGAATGAAATVAGESNSSLANEDNVTFLDASVFSPNAPALLTDPFTPQGGGFGNLNIDRTGGTGPDQVAYAAFSIPEPATWATMILGLAGVGAAMRAGRRRDIISEA